MASGPITSWQTDEKKVTDFIFLGSKITMDGDYSHKLKDTCFLGGKLWQTKTAYWKPETLLCQQRSAFKAMVFAVVMYRCESWTINKTEYLRTDAFKSWCWRRLLRVPWTAKKSNQSILKEINPEYSFEGMMLKIQYFGTWWEELTHWERPWCWERLMAKRKGAAEDEMVR